MIVWQNPRPRWGSSHCAGVGSYRWGFAMCSFSGAPANGGSLGETRKSSHEVAFRAAFLTHCFNIDSAPDMALLPRVPPASIVCPSAPFLAPRLLHGPALWAALHPACSTGATYATKNGKRANARKKQTPSFKVKHLIKPDIVKDHVQYHQLFAIPAPAHMPSYPS